jgi:adenylate cyclase
LTVLKSEAIMKWSGSNIFPTLSRPGKFPVRLVALALLTILVGVRIADPQLVESLRHRAFDMMQQWYPRAESEIATVIVDIDEKSLAEVGQWPWSRTTLGKLVERLTSAGAKVIAFDVLFAERDRLSPDSIVTVYPELPDAAVSALRSLPSNDDLMAQSMAGARVVLGEAADSLRRSAIGPRPESSTRFAFLGPPPDRFLLRFPSVVRNLPVLERAASGHGIFSVAPEADNIVRRVPMLYNIDGRVRPGFALEALRVAAGETTVAVSTDAAGVRYVATGGVRVDTDRNGLVGVYFAPSDRERYVSASEVLSGAVPRERLAGKFALVGTSAAGLRDLRATPLAQSVPGIEVHAQVIDTVLAGGGLLRPNYALGLELTVLVLAGALFIIFMPRLGPAKTFALGGGLLAALVAFSWYAFVGERFLVDYSYSAIGAGTIFVFLAGCNYFSGELEKRRIRGAFSHYLSPDLVSKLAADPAALKLGGETRNMTFLFCDVRGFTTISEQFKSNPQGLTQLINRFLTPLTDLIMGRRGTIDKYMGDCIMAFWNAPLDVDRHPAEAAGAALAMIDEIRKLNVDLETEAAAEGRPCYPINIGIGLNTGDVVVGNMGSARRFDYSVLGDAVNLAARLEGQSKTYGVSIVMGEATYEECKEDFATIELDMIAVKGKSEAVRIYALLGDRNLKESPEFAEYQRRHRDFLGAYRAQDWDLAEAMLQILRHMRPDMAGNHDLYAGRMEEYRALSPGMDWDGVHYAKSK